MPDSRWQLEQWRQRRGVQFQPEQPALNANGNIGEPFRFSSVKCQFRAVVLRRKGAVAYGVQQEVQTKGACFRSRLDRAGKICIAVEAETPHTAWRDHWMKHCQQEMTVIQNAWPVVCNFGWLIEADRNARKSKRYRAEVLNFYRAAEDNLFTIQQGL